MVKYCDKCCMNLSLSFDECPVCGGDLTVLDSAIESKREKEIFEMTDEEILEKYRDYKNYIEKEIGILSDKDFITAIREGQREASLRRMNSMKQTANISQEYRPKCPTCGSPNVEKISLSSKIVGGALFGLFSDNVRKTMHCKNCNYKW